jgi:hypothetical protein
MTSRSGRRTRPAETPCWTRRLSACQKNGSTIPLKGATPYDLVPKDRIPALPFTSVEAPIYAGIQAASVAAGMITPGLDLEDWSAPVRHEPLD